MPAMGSPTRPLQLGGHPEPGPAHRAAGGPRDGLHVWCVRARVLFRPVLIDAAINAGKGVYFADMVSKSANYCFTNRKDNTGVLLLCDVALGDHYERFDAEVRAAAFAQ